MTELAPSPPEAPDHTQVISPYFYFNNSGMQNLSCSRKYYLATVLGLLRPPGGNPYQNVGKVFHRIMESFTPTSPPFIMSMAKDKRPAGWEIITEVQFQQAAGVAQKIVVEHPELWDDCIREHVAETDYLGNREGRPIPIDSNSLFPKFVATLDLISYDQRTDTVIITDFKTTSKPIDGNLVRDYKLQSQRPFYFLSLQADTTLPDHYRIAIEKGKLAWRYCFVAYTTGDYLLQPPELLDQRELDTFHTLIYDKVVLAQALHLYPDLAYKDGILVGQCWKCPYQQVCLNSDETVEQTVIQNWPYGRRPYDPRRQAKEM